MEKTAPDQPVEPPVTAYIPPAPQQDISPRPAKKNDPPNNLKTLYDKIGMTLALLLAFTIAFCLWLAGAFFTLQFLENLGVRLASAGLLKWLIPAAITAAELWLWPKAQTKPQQIALFLVVLAFDIGTSWVGLHQWASGRTIPSIGTLPTGGPIFGAVVLIVVTICAFWPEKLGRWSLAELWRVWR